MSASPNRFGWSALFWSFTAGVVFALTLTAAAALLISKAPIPFVTKVQQTVTSINPTLLSGQLDPNKKLYTDGQGVEGIAPIVTTVQANNPDEKLDAMKYWVQAGSFSQSTDAESMRARIAFIGLDAQVSYRNENGKRLYRVRIGPFDTEAQANEIRQSLADNSIQGTVIHLKAE